MQISKPCSLESVITTGELEIRPSRSADVRAENRAILELTRELAKSPREFFPKLVAAALGLSLAESSGISLLDEANARFVWPAVAGGLFPYQGGGTPRNFGPCGTVLDRNGPVLFQHPERHFTYLTPIAPPLEEVLLVPFRVNGKAVGTLWAVIHTSITKFQKEDLRLLTGLSSYASSAYKVLLDAGELESVLLPPKPR